MNKFLAKVKKPLTNTITTYEEAHNIYNIDKTKTYNVKNHRYTNEHYYNNKCK